MRKLILCVAVLVCATISSLSANEYQLPVLPEMQQDSTTRTPVKIEELPDAVRATLSSASYKEWTPLSATKITDTTKAEWYEVDLKKAEETTVLKIGKDGVVIQ